MSVKLFETDDGDVFNLTTLIRVCPIIHWASGIEIRLEFIGGTTRKLFRTMEDAKAFRAELIARWEEAE